MNRFLLTKQKVAVSSVVAGVLLFAAASDASAQQRSLFGGNSVIGGQTTQNQLGGGGGGGTGGSVLGGGARGGGQAGSAAATAQSGNQTTTGATLQGGFAGRPGVQGFVGQNANALQGGGGNINRQFNRAGGGGGFNQQGIGAFGSAGTESGPPLRPLLRIAFAYPTISNTRIETNLGSRLEKLPARQTKLKGVEFSVEEDGKVVLTGTVASEEASRVAAAVIRMEPGVRSVENNLTVATP
jgi:hypothetical protein